MVQETSIDSSKSAPIPNFVPMKFCSSSWKSIYILRELNRDEINISEQTKKEIHDEMWRNLIAEYDANFLSQHLQSRLNTFSSEFQEFWKIWLHDENNHYMGIRKIYSTIFEEDETATHKRVISRTPEFSKVEEFLCNEFIICVCLAYDELASTKGYTDAFPLYDSFCNPYISQWIRLAAGDEMLHAINVQNILLNIHKDKLSEAPGILRKIVNSESGNTEEYKATFLFDHGEDPGNNPFNQSFFKECANDTCRFLSVPLAFKEI